MTTLARKQNRRKAGFSLVELLMATTIVAILAGIAYPSYRQYFVRNNRVEAQQFLQEVANREEEYFLNNRAYTTNITGSTGLNFPVPSRTGAQYSFAVTVNVTSCGSLFTNLNSPSYCVTATPKSGAIQSNDGTLTLDSLGQRSQGSAMVWK
jgi:type IV pilus assembly protein PilE